MKNTRKHLIGLMIGLLIPLIYFLFFLFGCEKNYNYIIEGGYETLDGEYRVKVAEVEDTCDFELSEPWVDVMDVILQDSSSNGSSIVDVDIAGELWLLDVTVEANGDVNYEFIDEEWGIVELLTGKLTPSEADLTLTLEYLDWYGNVSCWNTFEMKGGKRYLSAP